MTEEELIRFLRIPEIGTASNHRHVIAANSLGMPAVRTPNTLRSRQFGVKTPGNR
jgi:hypothetical protein